MGPFSEGWSHADVQAVLERGLVEEVLYVPIVVSLNAPDCGPDWAESLCHQLARHPHPHVRANALLGFGHLARLCRALDVDRASEAIRTGMRDADEGVRAHAFEAASDLQVFMGVSVQAC